MNRSFVVILAVLIVVLIGGYFYFSPTGVDTAGTEPVAATTTVDVSAATQAAIDFCVSKGGTVETITAAEGVAHLCATPDGSKTEVGQYLQNNRTE